MAFKNPITVLEIVKPKFQHGAGCFFLPRPPFDLYLCLVNMHDIKKYCVFALLISLRHLWYNGQNTNHGSQLEQRIYE